eukprot:3920277-Pyramimonas_sp.AAC.1
MTVTLWRQHPKQGWARQLYLVNLQFVDQACTPFVIYLAMKEAMGVLSVRMCLSCVWNGLVTSLPK